MNFKKNWKRFCDLSSAREGFTLVELIVVIAILAILAGVAVPAYSGYVTKANKQADMTLISEIEHAIALAYYANPDFEGTEMVLVTLNGTTVSNGADSFLDKAMKAAFGDSYSTMALKYDNWGKGAAVTAGVLQHFQAGQSGALADVYNGNSVPTFAEDVDDLFELVRDTALLVAEKSQSLNLESVNIDIESGAELMKYAAEYTLGNNGAFGDVSSFQDAWSNLVPVGDMAGTGDNNILDNDTFTAETFAPAIATAAVVKARNVSIATYLQNQNPAYAKYYDAIANLGGTIPVDLAEIINNNRDDAGMIYENELANIARDLGVADDEGFDLAEFAAAFQTAQTYFADDGSGSSPAERDAMAYYALMDTVNATGTSTSENDDEYWNELAGAVSIYGQIASGNVSLEDALGAYGNNIPENSIAVLVLADDDGFNIKVNPMYVME